MQGKYKLIAPSNDTIGAGDCRVLAWPELEAAPVPFGLSNGSKNMYAPPSIAIHTAVHGH